MTTGYLYEIRPLDKSLKMIYRGSTEDFERRKRQHISACYSEGEKYNYRVYKYIREHGGWDKFEMVKFATVGCKDKRELETEYERAIIEAIPKEFRLNDIIPGRTRKEYYEERRKDPVYREKEKKRNRERKREKRKDPKYREKEKKRMREWKKQKYTCGCSPDKELTIGHKAKHERTSKHQKWLESR